MTTIFTRKALEDWSGRKPPPEVAYLVDGRVVTWKEVLDNRRAHQRLMLSRKREGERWRAVRVTVAHYGSGILGGWQTMLDWIGGRCWVERDGHWFKDELLRLYPLVLLIADDWRWDLWKKEFAQRYRRRLQCGQPVGVAFLWKKADRLSLKPC